MRSSQLGSSRKKESCSLSIFQRVRSESRHNGALVEKRLKHKSSTRQRRRPPPRKCSRINDTSDGIVQEACNSRHVALNQLNDVGRANHKRQRRASGTENVLCFSQVISPSSSCSSNSSHIIKAHTENVKKSTQCSIRPRVFGNNMSEEISSSRLLPSPWFPIRYEFCEAESNNQIISSVEAISSNTTMDQKRMRLDGNLEILWEGRLPKKHRKMALGSLYFSCFFCHSMFSSFNELMTHLRSTYDNLDFTYTEGIGSCPICKTKRKAITILVKTKVLHASNHFSKHSLVPVKSVQVSRAALIQNEIFDVSPDCSSSRNSVSAASCFSGRDSKDSICSSGPMPLPFNTPVYVRAEPSPFPNMYHVAPRSDWRKRFRRRAMEDFVDISTDEKNFFNLWNDFLDRNENRCISLGRIYEVTVRL
ncbi:hypothetical protein AB6A40_006714 [Gnathostoma spinigerum]|uniref:C2H2-type domain-containing protein n=1 Tax=Gnathostoma spinigerum TaxID=75299 RepID=A0ABD6EKC6_9BILA